MLDVLKDHLSQAQSRMKKFADAHRREVSFSPGDLVLLKLRPYRLKSLSRRVHEKLAPRFYGPFFNFGTRGFRGLPPRVT